jgi:excisionase family DNA binding protein
MTVADVAVFLAVPTSTVYDNWRKWDLPAFRVGRNLRFRPNEMAAWLDRQVA